MSRYEFAHMLESVQCRDCLIPDQKTKQTYTADWLATQKKNPQIALDDILFEQASFENKNYYYCVATVVDHSAMNGFPKGTSPYCPGKFCGSSFLTFAELIEASVRVIGPKIWTQYSIDRQALNDRIKNDTTIALQERTAVISALKRCGATICSATTIGEFEARLHRCTNQKDFCGFS